MAVGNSLVPDVPRNSTSIVIHKVDGNIVTKYKVSQKKGGLANAAEFA